MSNVTVPTYRPVDPGLFLRRTEEAQTRPTGGVEFWKPKAAPAGRPPFRNIIRLMPAHLNMVDEEGRADPFVIVRMHFSLGPKQDIAGPCRLFFKEECPAEAWIDELLTRAATAADPNTAKQLKDVAYKMRAQWRIYSQIVDRAAPERGVQTYAFGSNVEKRIRPCFFRDDGTFRDITDPQTGRWIYMDLVKKPNSDYNEDPIIRPEEMDSALPDMDWLQGIRDLTIYKYCPTLDDMAGALQGKRIERAPRAIVPVSGAPVPRAIASATVPTVTAPTPAAAAARPVAPSPAPVPTPAAGVAPPTIPSATVPPPARGGRRSAKTSAPTLFVPYAAARAECARLGFTSPQEIENVAEMEKSAPECYRQLTDPTDPTCQECIMILPCLTAKLNLPA